MNSEEKEAEIDIYPEDNVKLEWQHKTHIGAGLVNMGNTCFLNSVLQTLTYTAPLANYFICDGHIATCKQNGFCVMCELEKHIKRSLKKSCLPIRPKNIVENLGLIADTMTVGRQEDAHEFLMYLLDAMTTSALCGYNGLDQFSRETTVIGRIFGGIMNGQVKCLNCNTASCRSEPFNNISLEIKGVQTLVEALERYVTPETLSGQNAYMCDTCNKKVTAEKSSTIEKPPAILSVALQRFDIFTSRKLNHHIAFPEELDVRPYLTRTQGEKLIYNLYAVIVHAGSTSTSGHYYTYVKSPLNNWHCMNDAMVTKVKVGKVLSAPAYLIFYKRSEPPKLAKDKRNREKMRKEEKRSVLQRSNKDQSMTPDVAVLKMEDQIVKLQEALAKSNEEKQHQDEIRAAESKEMKEEFEMKVSDMGKTLREKEQEIQKLEVKSLRTMQLSEKLLKELQEELDNKAKESRKMKQQMKKIEARMQKTLEAREHQVQQEKKHNDVLKEQEKERLEKDARTSELINELQSQIAKLQEENIRLLEDKKVNIETKEEQLQVEDKMTQVPESEEEQLNSPPEKQTKKSRLKAVKSTISRLWRRVTGRKPPESNATRTEFNRLKKMVCCCFGGEKEEMQTTTE